MNVIYGLTGVIAILGGIMVMFAIQSDIQIILVSVLILGGLNLIKGIGTEANEKETK